MQIHYKYILMVKTFLITIILLLFGLTADGGQEKVYWNQFRGPNGQGVIQDDRIPVQFGPEANVLWKTAIPPGNSSPVIWNNHIFLTANKPTNKKELITFAIDRKDGKILWRQVVKADIEGRFHAFISQRCR